MVYLILTDPQPIIEITNPAASTATAPSTQPVIQETGFSTLVSQYPMLMFAAGAMAILIFGWFALRYWLAITRPAAIKEIETPTINRMNASALEHMIGESVEEAEVEMEAKRQEAAPADLLAAVPVEADPAKSHKPDATKPA